MQFHCNVNPFGLPGQWYKANLHNHTTTSDGRFSPDDRVRQYQEKGYDILALTDHERTNDVSAYNGNGMLVLSGMETHPPCPGAMSYHVVCLNVPYGFQCDGPVRSRIQQVRDVGGEAVLAHPYWCGFDLSQNWQAAGAIAVEVFNTTCTGCGKGYSSVQYDELLAAGRVLGAVAVDDGHHDYDIFKGWTMIRAEELTPAAVMDALRNGAYYASCGPEIRNVTIEEKTIHVECSPVKEIHFLGYACYGRRVVAESGGFLGCAEYTPSDGHRYTRIEVVDAEGRRAWTNPIFAE